RCADPNQDRIQRRAEVLREVTGRSSDPSHVKPGRAHGDGREHVDAAVVAMKRRETASDRWNELEDSGERDHDGRCEMQGYGEVAYGVARDVPATDELAPTVKVAAQRGEAVERAYGEREHELSDEGDHEPESDGGSQGRIGHGFRFHSARLFERG